MTNASELAACMKKSVPEDSTGIVIKATHFHSNQGVYVLVDDLTNENPKELLRGLNMPLSEVMDRLSYLETTKIIVEEFVGSALPAEYKVHVADGEVAAIDIIHNRGGSGCACYAVVDANWNRLDKYGCFEPSGIEKVDGSCAATDFIAGMGNAGPIKKNLNLCSDEDIPKPEQCVIDDIINIATSLSKRIGVFMRVDMFVYNNIVYVQEYSPNHMGGMRHCAAKIDDNECIDSCFLGKLWKEKGASHGGARTSIPEELKAFRNLTNSQQCDLINTVSLENKKYTSTCNG